MPTGYTSPIEKGISLRNFILICARGMGACIMQRDDAMDVPPQKCEPSDYHLKAIAVAEKSLSDVKSLTDDIAEIKAKEEYKNEIESIEASIRKNNELKRKYEEMLSAVKSWVPPTSEHQGLKDFMVSQITESISFDCGGSYYREQLDKLTPLTGQEWKEKERKKAIRDINYHQCENIKEVSRCNEQGEWIEQLYKSLPKE